VKLYISCDMEGATGVVHPDQCTPGKETYSFGRHWQLQDALAVIRGAEKAGTGEILLNDSHNGMKNLDIGAFGGKVRLISGTPKPFSMMEGAKGCDALFFVAYHAKAGTLGGVLDHTMSMALHEVSLNGRSVGELGVNAALGAYWGVPTLLVTGDHALCEEARNFFSHAVTTCSVKKGVGRHAAELLNPEESLPLLEDAAASALEQSRIDQARAGLEREENYCLRVTLGSTFLADKADLFPEAVRVDGRTLEYSSPSMEKVYLWFRGVISLGG